MTTGRVMFAAAGAALIVVAVFAPKLAAAVNDRAVYGTFDTSGPPPRVDYCGRRYYPGDGLMTAEQVKVELARNGLVGLSRIGTAPSGMPVIASVMPPAVRAQHHTNVCTMEVWVQTGADSYLPHGLSGGP